MPKIHSLQDAFESLKLHFACLTETWMKGGKALDEKLSDFEGLTGIRVIHKSRPGKAVGGGVALAYDSGTCNFKRRTLKNTDKKHEVVCAVGQVGKLQRKFVVFVIYVPPTTRAGELQILKDSMVAEITAAKLAYKDPVILVGGDFNRRDFDGSFGNAEELLRIETPPTRGQHTLDIFYTNIGRNVVETAVLPPLETGGGGLSDHKCVYAAARFKMDRGYEWDIKMVRKRTKEAEEPYKADLQRIDWEAVLGGLGADGMAERFEEVISAMNDEHFPLVRVRKRSNEPPWMTRSIRRLFKRKVRLYKKNGKCARWHETDRRMQEEISEAQES